MADTPPPATPPRPRLNQVAVPLVGEFLLGMSVAMAGLYLAAHISDATAGAFGLVQQVLESLFVVFRVLAIGLGIMVTQCLGGGRTEQAHQTARMALAASAWAGLAVGAWLLLGGGWTLNVLNAPDELRGTAQHYMALLAPAMVLEAANLSMAAVLRAHLRARESLLIMLAMHSAHLLLAWPLMRGLGGWEGLGLPGYALAWWLSRALGLGLHLWCWRTRMQLYPRWRDWWRLRPAALWPVLRIGLPGGAYELAYRLAFMVSLAATARLGVAALATHSYTLQTLKYVSLTSLAIGWACEIMVGRLVGAGQLREAHAMVRKGVRNGLLVSGGLALLAALAAPWLMQLFTRDPVIIEAAQQLLWLSVALELGRVFNLVVAGALRAGGDIHFPVLSGLGSIAIVLGLGSYGLGRALGLPGIWLAYVADECVRGALLWWRWQSLGWTPHARRTLRALQHNPNKTSP